MDHEPDELLTRSEVEALVESRVRRYRHQALTGFLVLLVGLAIQQYITRQDALTARDAVQKSSQQANANLEKSGSAVAVDGCNRDFTTIQQLRAVLIAGRATARANFAEGSVGPVQHQRAEDFYRKQLSELKLPDCRRAADVITANNTEDLKVPDPLYPTGQR